MLIKIIGAVRRRGIMGASFAAARHVRNLCLNAEVRRYWRNVTKSNCRFDRRYGTDTASILPLDAFGVPTSRLADLTFDAMHEEIFRRTMAVVRIKHEQFTFVDYGCGKGKALLLASMRPFQEIIGIEFSPVACEICRRNIAKFAPAGQRSRNFEVVCADVLEYEPPPVPMLMLMNNPFREPMLEGVMQNLVRSIKAYPRPVWIIYCNPVHAGAIERCGMFELAARGSRYRVYKTALM